MKIAADFFSGRFLGEESENFSLNAQGRLIVEKTCIKQPKIGYSFIVNFL